MKFIQNQIKYFIFSVQVIHGFWIAIWSHGSLETFFSNLIWYLDLVSEYCPSSFKGRENWYIPVGQDSTLLSAGHQLATINVPTWDIWSGIFQQPTSEVGGECVKHYSTQSPSCHNLAHTLIWHNGKIWNTYQEVVINGKTLICFGECIYLYKGENDNSQI